MVPFRAIPALMLFIGNFVSYSMRVSINFTILAMTQNTTMCTRSASTLSRDLFCWSETEKSFVLGAFYYGYVILQVPGGRMAEVYGTKRVLGYATFSSGILMILSPWASHINVWFLILLRGLIGLAQGVLFPCINPMLVRWALEDEQARFSAFASMGGTFGTILIYPLCGFLLEKFHWRVVFYLSGSAAIIWSIFWFIFISDDPVQSRFIDREECELILSRRTLNSRRHHVPYCDIVKSRSVQVLMLCSFANDMGLYILLTEGPNFIKSVLKKDLKTVGFLSSLPYAGRFICSQFGGYVTDSLISKPETISKIGVRRMMFSIAFLSPAFGLALLGYLTERWEFCISVMTICFSFNGFNVGAFLNIIDIAPMFPGTTMGFVNGFSSIAGFIVPLVTASIIRNDPRDPDLWKGVFLIGTALYLLAVTAFFRYGKAEPATFNDMKSVQNVQSNDEMHLLVATESGDSE